MKKDFSKQFDKVLRRLPEIMSAAREMREEILSNLVIIGEVAAPTFREDRRIRLVLERFTEYGLHECCVDEKGNGLGILQGKGDSRRNILLAANSDSISESDEDPIVEVMPDRVVGPFVGDNSLALAALLSIPPLLQKLRIKLNSNIVFVAASRSLGRGNLDGLRFFLNRGHVPIRFGVCVEGVQLGRLNHKGLGVLRGDITCRLPDDYDWSSFGSAGSIIPMNDVISRISRISLPMKRPLTNIVLGSIHGGIAHQNAARQTVLSFEVRGESDEMLKRIEKQLGEIVDDVAEDSGMDVALDIFARRKAAGLGISHPLVHCAREILGALGIKPMLYSTTSALAALLTRRIPAITLGFTKGERLSGLDEIEEAAFIEPMFSGMAQFTGMLLAIDGGLCDAK